VKRDLTLTQPLSSRTRARRLGSCAAVALVLSLGLAAPGWADTGADKKKLDAKIAQLRTELEGTSQNLAQAFVELQRTKAALPAARQALTAADSAQAVADRRNDAVTASLAVAKANEAKARDALAQNALKSQKAQDRLGNLARDEYQQGEVSGLSVALAFGEIHPRTILAATRRVAGPGARSFERQLAWRDFHADVLWRHPRAQRESLAAVVLGTTLGMLLANVPVVLFGKAAAAKIPFKAVRIVAALLFAGLGVYALASGLPGR